MIVADTHAWVWWVGAPRALSPAAIRALEGADVIGISAMSCWEVAMLVRKQRLVLDRDVSVWIEQALSLPKIVFLELTPRIAVASTQLEWSNPDPADRIIVASALELRAHVVSKDRRIRAFAPADAIW